VNIEVINPRKVFGKTVAADVTHRLREELVTCRFKPGAPLRFEPLRTKFGASFSTLREALMALVAEGLVVVEGQRGFHVAPVTIADLRDITDVRVLIEVNMLRQSIARGDDEWEIGMMSALHRLSKIEERLSGRSAESPAWRNAHKDFHHALVAGCGSPALLGIRSSLYDRSERYRSLSATHRPKARDKVGEHRALMLAAIAREADPAAALIEQHIRRTTENVLKYATDIFRQI
jgi:GntR family carbon starvation induced transcriptional regulator